MNLRSFCIAKDTVIRSKQQLTEWAKIFTTSVLKRGLIIYVYPKGIIYIELNITYVNKNKN